VASAGGVVYIAGVSCVFGPVPSRRLGRSLGIDPIRSKTCNWNCVYCQLGRTTTFANERRDDVPLEVVLADARAALVAHDAHTLDWISFVGSGETTLARSLGRLVREVKAMTTVPVAVLTNGSLLSWRDVQEDLMAADAVLASLDAGSPDVFRRVDRPLPSLTFRQHVDGLVSFRQVYAGRLWIQVMLVKGLNDGADELTELAEALERIQPDAVHVGVPSRPPAEPWVRPAEPETVRLAEALLGERARAVVGDVPSLVLAGDDPARAVEEVVQRHPAGEEELVAALERGWPGQAKRVLLELDASGRARPVVRNSRRFWTASRGRYTE
jgi:wyosine [tRNA(Phe)-imidazoG37] synthetase (radical SAM superfamily)